MTLKKLGREEVLATSILPDSVVVRWIRTAFTFTRHTWRTTAILDCVEAKVGLRREDLT